MMVSSVGMLEAGTIGPLRLSPEPLLSPSKPRFGRSSLTKPPRPTNDGILPAKLDEPGFALETSGTLKGWHDTGLRSGTRPPGRTLQSPAGLSDQEPRGPAQSAV